MTSALEFLRDTQNPDGGWGYHVNGMSYVEPTAAVLLALREPNLRARDFLLGLQHRDGGWGIAALDDESGWMTAWAIRALAKFDERDAVARGVEWLLGVQVLRYTDPAARAQVQKLNGIDSTLRGFPWQSGDASWVQPTALAMLALDAAGQRAHPRFDEAVQYLRDRAIAGGGWNVGNPTMLGKTMPATAQDTALVLVAMRFVNANDAMMRQAIQYLRDVVTRAQTSSELAWTIYALNELHLSEHSMLKRLQQLRRADGSWDGNPFITALAILAGGV